ncbi:MAG TPA: hypothetical protein VND93_17460 [Myxococcales bacterium]|nr:hypothetical protein [Myxococcales bacterium]
MAGCGEPVVDGGGDDLGGQILDMSRQVPPTGKDIGTILNSSNHARNKIANHNGAVVTGTPNVYFIWYGSWTGNTAQPILVDFITNLGGSPWFQINTKYPAFAGGSPSGVVIYGGSVDDAYSHGPSLSDTDLAAVVAGQFASGGLPLDPNGIFVILGSSDVTATSGFCSAYCGQHSSAVYNGSTFRYVFVGNADRCPSACSPQALSPNGNAGADAMANALANELSTTITDPLLTAWYDRDGFESADKCAWTYGGTYTTSNGAKANVRLGTRDYLLQENWVPTNRGGVCAQNLTQAAALIAAGADILAQ